VADDPSGDALLAPGAEAVFDNIRFRSERGPALLPGARGADRDCAVELATALPDTPGATAPNELACIDGAACDADPLPRRCGFDVRLCVNVVDRHVLACQATDVASLRVHGQRRHPELAALATAADAILPTSDHACTATPTRVTVTIPATRTRARVVLHTDGRRADGLRDFDRFVLSCVAP
jgi:hypothetical protein